MSRKIKDLETQLHLTNVEKDAQKLKFADSDKELDNTLAELEELRQANAIS